VQHLRQDRRVLRLHHGVDDALRVDDDLDVVIRRAIQVVRLDDLRACAGNSERSTPVCL
jgi:hypothetical protein